jgi:RNA polymerase sigma factor (TIGR02999 family)
MPASDPGGEATRLLGRLSGGDAGAADELLPLLYAQLREIAGRLMSDQRAEHTLQPTALVNEAWLKLAGPAQSTDWESHRHFLRVAARAMRSVLVDHARAVKTEKRGAGVVKLPLDEMLIEAEERVHDVLAFDEALAQLEGVDAELAQVVELRFFGGLTSEEVGRALGLSTPTIERRWRTARMFLRTSLGEPG